MLAAGVPVLLRCDLAQEPRGVQVRCEPIGGLFVRADELLLKHTWRVGDLVAWSNRLVIHTATSTAPYAGQERLHTRIRMRSTPEHAPRAWRESE